MRSKLFQSRFVIVAGKGGVGRTTVCAALGLAAARYGLRTCILQLNTRDDIGRIYGLNASAHEPVRLDPQLPLFAADLRPSDALREYGQMKLRFRALHSIVFENDMMRRLLRMIPGMNEMLMLGKAWHMEAMDKKPDGSPTWDLLIVDAPATGHGVSLLRLPQVIVQAVPYGPMAEDANAMKALLEDPSRTGLHVVTLPQELPASEALELCEQAKTVLGVPTGYLFVNQMLPRVMNEAQRKAFLQHAHRRADGPLMRAGVAAIDAYEHWWSAQQAQLARLRHAAPLPIVELPHLFGEIDRAKLQHLSEVTVAGMESADARSSAERTDR